MSMEDATVTTELAQAESADAQSVSAIPADELAPRRAAAGRDARVIDDVLA